jgi:hypothetical protein
LIQNQVIVPDVLRLLLDRREPTAADQTERSQHDAKAHSNFDSSEKNISLRQH